MHSRRDHLGCGFKVWTGGQTWFWCLLNPCRDGGVIGAAATEADAVREAFAAIEEMSAQRHDCTPALRLPAGVFIAPVNAREAHRDGWSSRLDLVAEYLRGYV